MIESFIAVIISVISLKNSEEHIYRFLGVFLSSLRNEPAVFDKFKPSWEILKKMALDVYIIQPQINPYDDRSILSKKCLEFFSFLLRYHSNLDYNDVSEDFHIVRKLKRYDHIKIYNELEELQVMCTKLNSK